MKELAKKTTCEDARCQLEDQRNRNGRKTHKLKTSTRNSIVFLDPLRSARDGLRSVFTFICQSCFSVTLFSQSSTLDDVATPSTPPTCIRAVRRLDSTRAQGKKKQLGRLKQSNSTPLVFVVFLGVSTLT